MSDVTASYGRSFDFIAFLYIFIHNWRAFMSQVLNLHQTFTDYVSKVPNILNRLRLIIIVCLFMAKFLIRASKTNSLYFLCPKFVFFTNITKIWACFNFKRNQNNNMFEKFLWFIYLQNEQFTFQQAQV